MNNSQCVPDVIIQADKDLNGGVSKKQSFQGHQVAIEGVLVSVILPKL